LLPSPYSKKDISLYIDTTGGETGLAQQPDKIVVCYALTIYPWRWCSRKYTCQD